jgi:hypothetical protein
MVVRVFIVCRPTIVVIGPSAKAPDRCPDGIGFAPSTPLRHSIHRLEQRRQVARCLAANVGSGGEPKILFVTPARKLGFKGRDRAVTIEIEPMVVLSPGAAGAYMPCGGVMKYPAATFEMQAIV